MPEVSYETSTGKAICKSVLTKNVLYRLSYVGDSPIIQVFTIGVYSVIKMVEGAGFEPA